MLPTPQNDPFSTALQRCGVPEQETGPWSVWLERAIEQYKLDLDREAFEAKGGAPLVAKELNAFHRSLRRCNDPKVAAKRVAQLSPEACTFITMRLRLQTPPIHEIDGVNLGKPADVDALVAAVGDARSWLGGKPGSEHKPALRCLVRSVASVYAHSTGKAPGISSSQTTLGLGYMTPFEELLSATLMEAGASCSPEAIRSLYRAMERGKPKK